MNPYVTIGERADKMVGRHFWQSGIGFGRIVEVTIVWANVARITVLLQNGHLLTIVKPQTI